MSLFRRGFSLFFKATANSVVWDPGGWKISFLSSEHQRCMQKRWPPFPLIPIDLSLKNCRQRTTGWMLSINSADSVSAEYFPTPPSFGLWTCVCFSPSLEAVVSSLEPLQRKSPWLIYDVLIHPRRRAYHSRMTDKHSKMKRARSVL